MEAASNAHQMVDIYLVQNKTNGKQYIGQAVQVKAQNKKHGYLGRWKTHKTEAKHKGKTRQVLHDAIRKYGADNFDVQLLVTVDKRDANDYEIMMIDMYKTRLPFGYNGTEGGSGCATPHTDETKAKISAARKKLDLPMYVSYIRVGNNEGYYVRKNGQHRKSFTSGKFSMEEKLQMAVDFLAEMPEEKPPVRSLPKHVTRTPHGLLVAVRRNSPEGRKYVFWKSFNGGSEDEQLQRAEHCVVELKEQGLIK